MDRRGADLTGGTPQLVADLHAMCGVWHDHLTAFGPDGREVSDDPHGGVPGPFPYDNLVYLDFDGATLRQTNVTFGGREPRVRTFESDVRDGVLHFRRLGPEAPRHVGVSGGPGIIWFVPGSWTEPGLGRYSEPDHIRIDGDRRWRTTVLYRNGPLVRTMFVEGTRLTTDTACTHALDPRGAGAAVHEARDVTHHFAGTPAPSPSPSPPTEGT